MTGDINVYSSLWSYFLIFKLWKQFLGSILYLFIFFIIFFFRKNRFGNHNIQITIILEFFATAFNQRYDIYISILSLPADFILLLFFPSFSFFLKKILQKFSKNSPKIPSSKSPPIIFLSHKPLYTP